MTWYVAQQPRDAEDHRGLVDARAVKVSNTRCKLRWQISAMGCRGVNNSRWEFMDVRQFIQTNRLSAPVHGGRPRGSVWPGGRHSERCEATEPNGRA